MCVRVFVLFLAVVLAACGNDAALEATGPGGDDEPALPAVAGANSGRWEPMPPAPIPAREGGVIGWTGQDILVVGGTTFVCPPGADCAAPAGSSYRSDAAALDPTTRTWRAVAEAPVPVPPHSPRTQLDGDVYVLVPSWSDAEPTLLLRYRAAADTWESVDVPTATPISGLLATDDRIVVYSGSDERGEVADLSFDPDLGTWSEMPADPLSPSFDRHYAWDGEKLHLFAKDITPSPGGESGPSVTRAAVLHQNGTWEQLPTGTDTLGFWASITHRGRLVAPQLGCADGGEVNNYGRCIPYGGVFDNTSQTWKPLPNTPFVGQRDVQSAGAFTADEVLLTAHRGHMLDLTTDTWIELPAIDGDAQDRTIQRTLAGAGRYGFAFGGARFDADPAGHLAGRRMALDTA